jgi:hypothetical protein
MKRIGRNAMETPVSMMLLIFTALLIGSVIVTRPDEGDTDDLTKIRLIQARSLAFAITNYITSEGEDVGLLVGDERLEVFSGGGGDLSFSRDPGRANETLSLLLSMTPDGLEASLLFSSDEEEIPHLEGGRFSIRTDLPSGMVLTVTLPHHRGSMRPSEGSF